jgi:hypothetical protein
MEKLPTAEEFLNNKFKEIYNKQPEGLTSKIPENRYLDLHVTGRIDGREQNYPEMMIEFAKLHAEAALKAANEKATILEDGKDIGNRYFWDAYNTSNKDIEYEINKDSILNAYPLDNIK